MESLFSEVARKISALNNSIENSNTCISIFRKIALLKILRNLLLNGVACFQSSICNATNNKLQTKFLKGLLKLTEIFLEVISNGVPF